MYVHAYEYAYVDVGADMACDCSTMGLDEVFGERVARRDARRFQKRGLARRARKLVGALEQLAPLAGVESLEIGAGAGGLTVTLLERGAARATAIDASPAFAAAARSIADRRQLADRMTVVAGDFAAHPNAAPSADVVVLDRVVCCYPDLPALLRPAAERARRAMALSYPRDGWWARLLVRTTNAVMAILRRRFRTHFHPPGQVHALLADAGFATTVVGHVGPWELLVASRTEIPGQAR